MPKYPQSGSKAKDVKEKEQKRRDRKLVITMASYALQYHLGWCTQAVWANFKFFMIKAYSEATKVGYLAMVF